MSTAFRVLRQIYRYNMNSRTVAASLGMGYMAMQRKLKAEGTNFSLLLTRVKTRMAANLIAEGKTLECIAYEIDMTERSTENFIREKLGATYTTLSEGSVLEGMKSGGDHEHKHTNIGAVGSF